MLACLDDKAAQAEFYARSKKDIIFWLDTFGWTFAPKLYPICPDRPFITWEFQEEVIHKICDSIGKNDLLIEKSRDMGATWMVMAAFLHRCIFYPSQLFLIGSRKEELVDQSGDPGCLMWKIDYMLGKLPPWMRPPIDRTRLHMEFLNNGSVIDGESTNDDFGRGDRRQGIALDEFASVENGDQILSATRDTSDCRIMLSTPKGAYGAFHKQRVKIANTAPERLLRLHWTLHPEKARGLYHSEDGKPHSPWYDEQCIRAASPVEIAQELDIDYAASSWKVMDHKEITRIVKDHCRAPLAIGEFMHSIGRDVTWFDMDGGRVRLWTNLIPKQDGGFMAPEEEKYIIGCDISMGKGGEESSQSVASVWSSTTNTKVAQFNVRDMNPADFAEYAVAMCRFFNNAYLCYEVNGPGNIFGKRVMTDLRYSNVFHRSAENKIGRPRTQMPGFYTTNETKRLLLMDYFKSLRDDKVINRAEDAVLECGEYDHFPSGVIAHCRSQAKNDPAASGQNHGDIVIADALACRAMQDRVKPESTEKKPEEAEGSFFWRREQYLKKKKLHSSY